MHHKLDPSAWYRPTQILIGSSKDKQIRLWDAVGGMCVRSITDCLGEITSVEFDRDGKYLLAGCKDNSNRLFDLRMVSFNRTELQNLLSMHDVRNTLMSSIAHCTGTLATKTRRKISFGAISQLATLWLSEGPKTVWSTFGRKRDRHQRPCQSTSIPTVFTQTIPPYPA